MRGLLEAAKLLSVIILAANLKDVMDLSIRLLIEFNFQLDFEAFKSMKFWCCKFSKVETFSWLGPY